MDRNLLHGKIGTKPIMKIIMFVILITSVGCFGDSKDIVTKQYQEKYQYNNEGKLTDIIGSGGKKITLKYNERGQLYTVDNGNEKQTYEYTRLGLLKSVKDNTGTTGLEHDSNGRLQKMSYPQGDIVTYEYSEYGGVTSVAWGDRHYLRFRRDLLGNPVKIETPSGDFAIRYDYTNRMMWRTYPNGAMSLFQYNQHRRPVLIQHTTPNNRVFLELRYSYDDAGLLKTVSERNQNKDLNITYSYDAYGQLLKAEYSDGRNYVYEYDIFGNRLRVATRSGETTATYNEHDQLKTLKEKSVKHDAVGNVTTLGSSKFTYNANDSLIDDGIAHYTYNAPGLRVEASGERGTTRFIHLIDDLPYVLAETGDTTKRYLWAEGQCLGQIEDNGRTLFFFEDHLGSLRSAMDTAGNIVGGGEYSPFGAPIKRIAGVRFGFAGEEQDETGKVYLRARYYLPEIGRFLSKDPVLPQLMDEIKQNRYAYAANSPMNYTDRNGVYPESEDNGRRTFCYNTPIEKTTYLTDKIPSPNLTPPVSYTNLADVITTQRRTEVFLSFVSYLPMGRFSSLVASASFGYHTGREFYSAIDPAKFARMAVWNALSSSTNLMPYIPNVVGNVILNSKLPIPVTVAQRNISSETAKQLNIPINKASKQIDIPLVFAYGQGIGKPVNIYQHVPLSINDLGKVYIHQGGKLPVVEYGISDVTRNVAIQTFNALRNPSANVGGVYLDKAAEVIGDLSNIEGLTFDPVTNRLLLIGKDANVTTLPPFRADDLSTVFRSVFGNYSDEPGVTIDPNPKNPRADKMIVRFFGGMENTHFGQVLFEADRQMKSLSLGKDNITKQEIKAHMDGYYNMLELGFSNLGGRYDKNLWSRFWLVPEQIPVRLSEDKKSIMFPDTRIRVKTETMQWNNGKLVPAKGQKDEKAEYFAAHFTKYYDEYAKEFPVYEELKHLTNLVGLAKWVKESGIRVNLDWLKKYETPFETPKTTPSLTVSDQRRFKNGNSTITEQVSIFGGTDLTVENAYIKDDGTAAQYAKQALEVVADHPGMVSGTFVDAQKQTKRVVTLPTSQTRIAGAKILQEGELQLLTRSYCSFHNDAGQFGHSWFLDLPVLHISQPHRRKQEYVSVGKRKVLVQTFRLTKPFGMQDVYFEKHDVDQQYARIAFLPDKNEGIRALYPDPKNKEYRVEYTDGSADVFDTQGSIVRQEITPSITQTYSYDSSGRLSVVSLMQQDKKIAETELSYDDKGRIFSAMTLKETINYDYDTNGDLKQVVSPKAVIKYIYDDRHLVTCVLKNGKLSAAFEYDEFGRLLSRKDANGNLLNTGLNTVDGKTEITENTGDQRITRVYDAGGRLLETHNASSDKVAMTYHDSGAPKVVEYTNRFGDKTSIEYAPDNSHVKYTDPEENVRALLFDEFGRLKQIQDERHALVNKKYGQTKQGWMEFTETSEIKAQTLFTEDMNPAEQVIIAKTPQGGQLMTQNKYDSHGLIQHQVTQGLIAEELFYENGRLKIQKLGDETASFSYTADGLLKELTSGKDQYVFSYHQQGSLQDIALRRGDLEQRYEFQQNGQLAKRSSGKGLNDVFQYDREGLLQSVQHSDGEQWEIHDEEQENGSHIITYRRNSVVQIQYVFDEKGRLKEMVY